ncbi:SUMF1/EgtB/PvdO family nonheme iron enzyme [Cellvibrio sp. KY-GH-1]|uniref:formylglycine-generating enzyme family protein n=1 Tax=Cellvibrio sp. KY-GH-1 TaxID=2303332 RepID=UPI0017815813|nr:SUMF1/EgtB/PvdO family nonheme iron enzyme [Cellvibrio sp. KY-GH-1]
MKSTILVVLVTMFLWSLGSAAEQEIILPSMVSIPAGTFTMGSDTGEGFKVFHSPAHEVRVKTFQLSRYEVTVKEFRKFVEATNHKTRTQCWKRKAGTSEIEMVDGQWNSPAYAPTENYPVMCVGRDDAKAYAAWLSKKTGNQYRLPSEAEWEYAARAGSKENYFFGNNEQQLCEFANVLDESGSAAFKRDLGVDWPGVKCNDKAEYTSAVGMYKPNAFGLYDMIGNVGELVEDCQHFYYTGAPKDGSAWVTGCEDNVYFFGLLRSTPMFIHRGGNYGLGGSGSHIFLRGHTGGDNASSLGEGFRLAMDVDSTPSQTNVQHTENTRGLLTEYSPTQKKPEN